jgi:hypothetical protein
MIIKPAIQEIFKGFLHIENEDKHERMGINKFHWMST